METLHCTTYDEVLQASLPHLTTYPQLLPFIGSAWRNQNDRILFVAESHYLAKTSNGKSNHATWYLEGGRLLTDYDRTNMNTRRVVAIGDNYKVTHNTRNLAFSIFYNIKSALFEVNGIKNKNQNLFQNFGYYNYFQRPAEKTGESIKNGGLDNRIAYQTLKTITEHTKPTAIIFVSKLAHTSFMHWRNTEQDAIFSDISIQQVPHPASAWWNKPSEAYAGLTGKQKFINVIKKTLPNQKYSF